MNVDKVKLREFLISIKNEATKQAGPLSFLEVEKIIQVMNVTEDVVKASTEILKKGHYVTDSCIMKLENENFQSSEVIHGSSSELEERIISDKSQIDPVKNFMISNRKLMLEIRNYFSVNEIYLVKQINWNRFLERREEPIKNSDQEMIIRIYKDMGIFSKSVKPYVNGKMKKFSDNEWTPTEEQKLGVIIPKIIEAKENDGEITKEQVIDIVSRFKGRWSLDEVEKDGLISALEEKGLISKEDEISFIEQSKKNVDYELLSSIEEWILESLNELKSTYEIIDEEDVLNNVLNYHDEIRDAGIVFSDFLDSIVERANDEIGIGGGPINQIKTVLSIMNYLEINAVTINELVTLLKHYSFVRHRKSVKEPTLRRLMNSHSLETFGNTKSYKNTDPRFFWKPNPSTYELIDNETFTNETFNMNDIQIENYIDEKLEMFREEKNKKVN